MEDVLRKWQNWLGLDDWTIVLEDGLYELSLPECAGCTEWSEVGKTAKIQLLNSEAYGDRITSYDKEKHLCMNFFI